jgi:hypothetical protein
VFAGRYIYGAYSAWDRSILDLSITRARSLRQSVIHHWQCATVRKIAVLSC